MKFENKLIPGIFIKRYKRFFTDIKIKNKIITAHCPNTGSMLGLLNEGNKSWITKSDNKKRKLKYTLQIIKDKKNKIGINTHLTNKIVYEALKNNKIKEIAKRITIKPEQKFGLDTRFDFLITEKNKKSFIEVKNVTLSRKKGLAEFPDAKTSRGIKHLNSLIKSIEQGYCGYLLFVIQREDCKSFSIAKDIDPEYSKLLTIATKKKVKLLCYDCKFSSKGIKLNNRIKIENDE
jgi:sugar fermentation stimulation protein A